MCTFFCRIQKFITIVSDLLLVMYHFLLLHHFLILSGHRQPLGSNLTRHNIESQSQYDHGFGVGCETLSTSSCIVQKFTHCSLTLFLICKTITFKLHNFFLIFIVPCINITLLIGKHMFGAFSKTFCIIANFKTSDFEQSDLIKASCSF